MNQGRKGRGEGEDGRAWERNRIGLDFLFGQLMACSSGSYPPLLCRCSAAPAPARRLALPLSVPALLSALLGRF